MGTLARMTQSSAALKRRWTTADGRELVRAAERRLRDRQPLDGLGLESIDGRVDLRFIPLTADFSLLDGVELRRLDFSGAMAANLRFVDSVIADCRFDSADCQFWHLRACLVMDTSFLKADLRNATLGEWYQGRGNRYRSVHFGSARLRNATTSAATYEDCDFAFAELERVNFWQSSLIRCTFAGPLRDVVFDGRLLGEGKPDGNPMLEVDLTEAVLDGCDFRGVSFDSVRLPNDPQVVLIRDKALMERAAAALAGVDQDPAARLAHAVLHHIELSLDRDGVTLINLRDAGEAADLVGGLLRDGGLRP
ncbi:hypothetical protein GCM10022225_67650 [Plantactinospora mayteni]